MTCMQSSLKSPYITIHPNHDVLELVYLEIQKGKQCKIGRSSKDQQEVLHARTNAETVKQQLR